MNPHIDLLTGETPGQMAARDKQDQHDFDTYHATWQDWARIEGALVFAMIIIVVMDWWRNRPRDSDPKGWKDIEKLGGKHGKV